MKQVAWSEVGVKYERVVSVLRVKENGVAKVCHETFVLTDDGRGPLVDAVEVEAMSLERAFRLLGEVVADPSYRGWLTR